MRYAIKQCGLVPATVDYLRGLAKTENKVINYCDYRGNDIAILSDTSIPFGSIIALPITKYITSDKVSINEFGECIRGEVEYGVVDFVYKPCVEKDVEYIVYYLEEK